MDGLARWELMRLEMAFLGRGIAAGVAPEERDAALGLLSSLKERDDVARFHYTHCLRVGLLAADIARFVHMPEKPALLSGALHDIGKCEISSGTLGKTDGWTSVDACTVRRHARNGWRILRGRFDFVADVIVRHHSFQQDSYPKRMPRWCHGYSETTKVLILEYARIVALADVYDALHRVNGKFGVPRALTSAEIRSKMLELNSDRELLITHLYWAGVLGS